MPGRTRSSEELYKQLQEYPLEMIQIRPWQEDYDLVWALKPGVIAPLPPRKLEDVMICPVCEAPVVRDSEDSASGDYRCRNGHVVPVGDDGIVDAQRAQ
jgi:hypothetical protein